MPSCHLDRAKPGWAADRSRRPVRRRSRFRAWGWLGTLALLLLPAPKLAAADATTGGGWYCQTLNLLVENDLVSGADRHFTHGMQASCLSAADDIPDLALRAAAQIPLFDIAGAKRFGYALGQNMYTPSDIQSRQLIKSDRPYAGWLYGSVALISEARDVDGSKHVDRLETIDLDVGIIGPASLAEQVQTNWHSLIGVATPKGWNNQLRNEPGIDLVYVRKWRIHDLFPLGPLEFDLTPHLAGSLGNVETYAAAGGTVRIGGHLEDDYGPPRIRPALPGSGFFHGDGFAWYFFAGVEGRAVARDIFLDGNTFARSHSVDKEPFVGDLQAGFALIYRDVRFAYTQIYRTKQFHGQSDPDRFGSFSLSVKF